MPYTTRKMLSDVDTHTVNFGTKDKQGREHGIMIERALVEFVDEGADWGHKRPAGEMVMVYAQTTKDGKRWGATQDTHYFATEAESDEYIKRRITETRKRAAKAA